MNENDKDLKLMMLQMTLNGSYFYSLQTSVANEELDTYHMYISQCKRSTRICRLYVLLIKVNFCKL